MSEFIDINNLSADSLGRVFVETDEVRVMFQAFDELIAEPSTATNGKGVAVLGPPRCGKTMVVQEYLMRCQKGDVSDRVGEGVTRRPLKFLHVPLRPATRLNTIASRTLERLGHPAPFHGRHDAQTSQVVKEIKSGGYELVIFDEIHHLVSSETRRVRENGSHWLTHILDETKCPMALVGYSGFREILNENEFLGGRLVPAPPLRPYVVGDPKSFGMFRYIIEEFEARFALAEKSNLSQKETSKRILILCNGRLGFLVDFLSHARVIARRKGYNCIRHEVLVEAANHVRHSWCGLRFNPFEVDDLSAAMEKFGASYSVAEDIIVPRRKVR